MAENAARAVAMPVTKKVAFKSTNVIRFIEGAGISNLRLENNDHFLLEDGSVLILESN